MNKMIRSFYLLLYAILLYSSCEKDSKSQEDCLLDTNETILFNKDFRSDSTFLGFANLGYSDNFFSDEGLFVCDSIQLDRQYSLAERKIVYNCKFGLNTIAEFSNTRRGVIYTIDVRKKLLYINNTPYSISFVRPGIDYSITIERSFQRQSITIIGAEPSEIKSVDIYNDGPGGNGQGVINSNSIVYDMSNGSYKVALRGGSPFLCSGIRVATPYKLLVMLIYGDSITEPEAYYPTSIFPFSWTQLVINEVPLTTSSGTGGGIIDHVYDRMRSELPYLKVKNVMITVGTNGGNTVEKLSNMVEYILSLGINPILNHIPCNESNTQIEVNRMIDEIRNKYGIMGVDFDKATSLNGDGLQLDKSLMFWEDYGPDYLHANHDYWHHPNEKGSKAMFDQFCHDILGHLKR